MPLTPPDTFEIKKLKDNWIQCLKNLTWLPDGSQEPTSFIGGVFNYFEYGKTVESPYAFVVDLDPTQIIKHATKGVMYEKRTPIATYICHKMAQTKQSDIENRLIYAYEAIEKLATNYKVMDAIGCPGYCYKGCTRVILENEDLYIRKLIFEVQSRI